MREKLLSTDTAKLAQEKGFNTIKIVSRNRIEASYNTPTQSLLQRWLRELHNIHLYVVPVGDSLLYLKYYYFSILGKECNEGKHNINRFITYEEALEAGLIEGLKLIK